MGLDLVKYAFVAGELSPTFLGRTDLEKYDLGLELARNWFVDYRGGLTTRPGTVFVDFIKNDHLDVKMFDFKFAPNIANTYVLLFSHLELRFVQDGAYVLETAVNITGVTQANPGVVTANAHGYSNGDWVKISGVVGMTQLNGRTFQVAGVAANTFQLKDPLTAANINTSVYAAYVSGGTVARIHTVSTPYASTDLEELRAYQYRDLVRLTHPDFTVRELVRVSATSWTLTATTFGSSAVAPQGLTGTAETAGGSGLAFAVTSVNTDGEESINAGVATMGTVDFTATAASVTFRWNATPDTLYYNLYGSLLVRDAAGNLTVGEQLGYLGRSFGTVFNNRNIIPDFTKAPPKHRNPFMNGGIESISITNDGSGYATSATVSVSGGAGSGFVGVPVVDPGGGEITGVMILQPGSGYVNPTVSFAGGGAGATATAVASPLTGNNPRLSTVFQQRQLYAASDNAPLTIWGSKPKQFDNFDESTVIADNDAYEFELDAEEVTPIKHLLPVRGGLLVMTEGGLWVLSGGGQNDPVTATNALAEPHTYLGVSDVPPIKLDTDLLYIEPKGQTVRLLTRNDIASLWGGEDISILSNHFFSPQNPIVSWTFADDPFKLVWGVREDGSMLSLTAVKEQKVFAWAQHWTKGLYYQALTIQEDQTDSVYLIVTRHIAGRETKFLERMASKRFDHIEDSFCVDCGLSLGHTYPAAALFITAYDGAIATLIASVAVFAAPDVGKIIRAGGGKFRITGFDSTTQVDVVVLRAPTAFLPEDPAGSFLGQLSGTWTMDAPITAISGLWHLEGESVSILADGNVVSGLTVENGAITLPNGATTVHVGLGFTAKARTLPITIQEAPVEARRKRLSGTATRLHESRGVKAGLTLDSLYTANERHSETPGEPNDPLNGISFIEFEPDWTDGGQFYYVVDKPLPASILGFVVDTEVGDDPD